MRAAGIVGLVVVFTGFAAVARLAAQTDTGVLDGRVFDQQGAVVQGVAITAKSVATGATRTAVSGPTGTYHIEALRAGGYDVTAALSGFSTQLRKGVSVQIGTSVTVDFIMTVGSVQETVTVTAEVPLVQTTRSDVGQVITTTMVENIPLNGRKFQDLSLLVPGTWSANFYDPTKTEVGGVSYGGLSGRSVNISVDGGDNNDGVVRGLLQQFSADAIQEYKVTTQRYSAEFGRSTGGLVNVITKSGSNEFRGSAFLFARNQSLNAKTYFEEANSDTSDAVASTAIDKQPFSQQQLGGTIGGPIARDKAHFFFSYEFNRRNDYAIVNTGGILPAEEGPFPKPFRNHLVTAKADMQLKTGNTLTVRYALEDQKREHDFIGGSTLASGGALNTNAIHSIIVKDAAVLGTSKLNELLVLYQHFENNITADDETKPGIATPGFTFGANGQTPQQTIQRRIQIRDDFSFRKTDWKGDHDFKVGGELIASHYGGFYRGGIYGSFSFFSQLPGDDLDAYLNAVPDAFFCSAGDGNLDYNWTYLASYIQDNWRPQRNLTVNLGLRWEMQAGPYQNNSDTPVLQYFKSNGYRSERKQDLRDFGPRVGFAWDVKGDGRTVVRGGYGLYYDEIFANIVLFESWSDVRTPFNTVFLVPAPFTPAYYSANRDAIQQSLIDPTFAGQVLWLTAPDLRQPYSHQFTVGFSREVHKYFSFDADYVHAKGRRPIARWWINTIENLSERLSPPGVFEPVWSDVVVQGNRGHSQSDALYLAGKVRKGAVQIITTYAYTKSMDIGDDYFSSPADATNLNDEADWGPAANDIRHRFTLAGVFQLPKGVHFSTAVQANTGKPYSALLGLYGNKATMRAIDPAGGAMYSRNSFRGPGFFTWDARIAKEFRVGGKRSIEVLFEMFNMTNRVNLNGDTFTGFSSVWGTDPAPLPTFGKATNIVPNSQFQAEFGVRLRF